MGVLTFRLPKTQSKFSDFAIYVERTKCYHVIVAGTRTGRGRNKD